MSPIHCLPLSATPEAVPILAAWFKSQWPDYYAGRSLAEIERDFPPNAPGELPQIVVAWRNGVPCGTAALRDRSITAFAHLSPWLGGLFVPQEHRRTGVATALLEAVAAAARTRGVHRLYAGTVEAQALFDALGWRPIGEAVQEGERVAVYERDLRGRGAR